MAFLEEVALPASVLGPPPGLGVVGVSARGCGWVDMVFLFWLRFWSVSGGVFGALGGRIFTLPQIEVACVVKGFWLEILEVIQ